MSLPLLPTPALLTASQPYPASELEQRRQTALALAQQCQQVLRAQFGATQVIIFGSLRGDSPWHWNSDLDLAVSGLSQSVWLQAYDALTNLAPDWLKIDLVRLEQISLPVYQRIVEKVPMPTHPYLALKAHLQDEVIALAKTTDAITVALAKLATVPEDFATRTLASYINDFYRRCERMSERVAVTLDGGLPSGVNWHQALLRQVAEANSVRPPLWTGALLLDLDEYRKFRHILHHKYGDELRPDYVASLAELAPVMAVGVQAAIAQFNQWLGQIAID